MVLTIHDNNNLICPMCSLESNDTSWSDIIRGVFFCVIFSVVPTGFYMTNPTVLSLAYAVVFSTFFLGLAVFMILMTIVHEYNFFEIEGQRFLFIFLILLFIFLFILIAKDHVVILYNHIFKERLLELINIFR